MSNLHNIVILLTNCEATGILTTKQRELLKEEIMPSNVKWNLFDIREGRLTKKIQALPEDCETILNSIYCWEWFINDEIKSSLHKTRLIIDKITNFHTFPTHRLKAECKKGKKMYKSQKLSLPYLYPKMGLYFQNADASLKSKSFEERREKYFFKIMRHGSSLRPNEWKFIEDYFKSKGRRYYDLPLQENRYYTWQEVKDELSSDLKNPKPIPKEFLDIVETEGQNAFKEIAPELKRAQKKLDKYDLTLVPQLTGSAIR